MISYWIEKYGIVDAVEEYAPPEWKADPVIQAALAQLKVAKAALQQRVSELDQGHVDED